MNPCKGILMKITVMCSGLVLFATAVANAQLHSSQPHPEIADAITADGSHYKVELENEYVRALRIHYGAHEVGNMHNHPHSVTVFLTEGKLKMTVPEGRSRVGEVPAGAVVYEDAGPHQPENLLDKPFEAVRIELKDPAMDASVLQNTMAADAGRISDKFAALAMAMKDKYDWRPGTGVRSQGEVFNLIVMENGMLSEILAGKTMQAGTKPEPITDPAKMQQAIAESYKHLQNAIHSLPAAELRTQVQLFGMTMSKLDAIQLILGDQHEHLGQSIAYARVNSIVPPWSR